MKHLLPLLLALTLTGCSLSPIFQPAPICETRWDGEIDAALVVQAARDFRRAQGCEALRIDLHSQGGSVIHGFEIIRLIERAREQGLIVEIHGGGLVASMATIVLAAGSKGHRYIYIHALTVVHGIQVFGTSGEIECFSSKYPLNESDEIGVQLHETMAVLLTKFTGRSVDVTRTWLQCGNEQYGNGWLLLKLGIVDLVE